MPVRYEICVGLNKGHKTAKIKSVKYTGDKKVKGLRSSRLKNVSFKRKIELFVGRVCVRGFEMMKTNLSIHRLQDFRSHWTDAVAIFFCDWFSASI